MKAQLADTGIDIDNEGYLLSTGDWTPELAEVIAREERLELNEARLEVVQFVRTRYE